MNAARPTFYVCIWCSRKTYHLEDIAFCFCPCCGSADLPKVCEHRPAIEPQRLRGDPPTQLTDRHIAILDLVAQGATNPEIALALHISKKTVETHMARIKDRVGIGRRIALAIWWHDLKK